MLLQELKLFLIVSGESVDCHNDRKTEFVFLRFLCVYPGLRSPSSARPSLSRQAYPFGYTAMMV